jgi:hypothetical protein
VLPAPVTGRTTPSEQPLDKDVGDQRQHEQHAKDEWHGVVRGLELPTAHPYPKEAQLLILWVG